MPGIDLSTLSGPELHRLLKLAHTRRDGLLADRLEWEIASRATDHRNDHASPTYDPEPDAPAFRPLAPGEIRTPAPEPSPPGRPTGLMLGGLGLVAGCLIGAAAAWGLVGREPPPTAEPARLAAQPAAREATILSAPASATPLIPDQIPTEAQFAAHVGEAVNAVANAPAPATRRSAPRRSVTPKYPSADPCAAAAIAADRMVCNDRTLAGLHSDMQQAYDRALAARADPGVVGAGQAAWRRNRDETSDPQRLAQLYDRRIRELNTAAADARAKEPIF